MASFLPSPEKLLNADERLKNVVLSLIQAARQLEEQEAQETTPISEAVEVVLREVMSDGCRYVSIGVHWV